MPDTQVGPTLDEVAGAFPKLEIIRLIGYGGMGYVYQARQPDLDRMVALKILSPALRCDPAFEERFAREARVLGKLQHPNIVTLYEHGESGGYFYLLMEYIDGVNLRQAMSGGRFTPDQALAIVPAICDALQSAHAQGVWHRDIKPENILLDRDGRVKIADFGIARIVGDPERNFTLTRTGGQLGSAAYMAPEQHEKPHAVDHRADIYSLGVVIYEMLTGELPLGRFPAPSQRAAVNARIDEIVLRTLEKEREMRQQSAGEVKTDVQGISCGAPVSPSTTCNPWQPVLAGIGVVWSIIAFIVGLAVRFPGNLICVVLAIAVGGVALLKMTGYWPWGSPVFRNSNWTGRNLHKSATPEQSGASRFSRTAIVGAAWMTMFFALMPPFLWHELETHEFTNHGPFGSLLGVLVSLVFLLPTFTAPFGTTILGCVALTQIRRSVGKLYGLGLALFDALLFPLLALDGLIVWMWWQFSGKLVELARGPWLSPPGNMLLPFEGTIRVSVACLVVALVDFLIIRWAWRAANKGVGDAKESAAAPATPRSSRVFVAYIIGTMLFGILGYQVVMHYLGNRDQRNQQAEVRYRVFEVDAQFVDKVVKPEWRTRGDLPGGPQMIGTPVNAASQMTEIDATTLTALLHGMSSVPGLLVDRRRDVPFDFWPALSESFSDARTNGIVGIGGFLGVRRDRGMLQLRVQDHVTYDMATPYTYAEMFYEGAAPQPGHARTFFIPFSRKDGARKYLIVAFEVGGGQTTASATPVQPPAVTPTPAPEPVTTSAVFGLQAERTLAADKANRDGVAGYRFKNNDEVAVPESLTGHFKQLSTQGFTPELKQWMRDNHVDMLFHFADKSYDVLFVDMRDGYVGQPREWDTVLPTQASPTLKKLEDLNSEPGSGISGGAGYRDGPTCVHVFRTREDNVGFYQLRAFSDADGHGVVIRSKQILAQIPETAVAILPGTEFSRAVTDPNDNLSNCLISFDDRKLLALPEALKPNLDIQNATETDEAFIGWMRENRADAVARFVVADGKVMRFGLRTFGVLAIPVDEEKAKQLKPADVAQRLDERLTEWGFISEVNDLMTEPGKPASFIVQTRSGQRGLLQITGLAEHLRGVMIHYMLMQNSREHESAVAAAPHPSFGAAMERELTDADLTLAAQPPVIVETFPVSGARDVPPGVTEIRARFSKPMADGSWSWCNAWVNSTPEVIGTPHYEADGKTCVLKVKLETGRTYAYWLNRPEFQHFMSRAGQPAVPYLLIFKTK